MLKLFSELRFRTFIYIEVAPHFSGVMSRVLIFGEFSDFVANKVAHFDTGEVAHYSLRGSCAFQTEVKMHILV